MRTRTLTVGLAAGLALLTAACGSGDDKASNAATADRTVNVKMVDTAFEPTELSVAKGETVRFVFENTGKAEHEAILGTPAEQQDHEKKMSGDSGSGKGMGNMGGGDDTSVSLKPGKTGEFSNRFDEAGTFEIGCHQPGHYDAGMKITITVA